MALRRYSKKVKHLIPQDLTKFQTTCTGTPEGSHFKFKIRLGSFFSLRKFLITLDWFWREREVGQTLKDIKMNQVLTLPVFTRKT